MYQSKNWCCTDFELLDWKKIFEKNKNTIRYVCWGKEECPKTKRKHYQCWLQLTKKKTLGGVKKLLNTKKIHLEACLGSEYDNEKYCQKDGKYSCLGKFIKRGQRTDLEELKELIKEGCSLEYIVENYFTLWCRYRRGILAAKQIYDKKAAKEWRDVVVEYVYGDTGTGKTTYGAKEADYIIDGSDLCWWDEYDGEETICIDEYNNDIGITVMLKLLDGHPKRLPVKGGFTWARWKRVIITSNLSPEELHPNAKEKHRAALFRRINKLTELI